MKLIGEFDFVTKAQRRKGCEIHNLVFASTFEEPQAQLSKNGKAASTAVR